ncbi:MAG: PKD domain-containing protein [Bacteroidetes bacterium]|nr:PKD domain-containing protein [Bacteroidota bacterium]
MRLKLGLKIFTISLFVFLNALSIKSVAQISVIAGSDVNICQGDTVQLNATATSGIPPFTYKWSPTADLSNPDIQNPTATPSDTVTYTVTVTDNNYATATDEVTINVKESPSALLADYSSDIPFTNCTGPEFYLTIENISTTIATNANYNINWGDGSPPYSAPTLPSGTIHTYNSQGYFSISYEVTGQNGCVSTNTFSVYNGSYPYVSIGNPGGTVGLCTPNSLVFPISSTSGNSAGTTYTITTNTGSPPVVFNSPPPSYTQNFTYSSCGVISPDTTAIPNSFFVRIRAENPCGLTASSIEPITTSIAPVVDFTISPDTIACLNTTFTFVRIPISGVTVNNFGVCDSSTKNNWTITPSTGWSVVSGSIGSPNPTNNPSTWGSEVLEISFTAPGLYTISTIARNSCGNYTKTRTVCILSPITPLFVINPLIGCVPSNVAITNTSFPVDECFPPTYNWFVSYTSSNCGTSSSYNYTNSTDSSSFEPSFVFNNSGTYNISLTATNVCDTFYSPIVATIVKKRPEVSVIDISSACGSVNVLPRANVLNCADSSLTYSWIFTGGTPTNSTLPEPDNVLFSALGTNTVSLSVTNECGFISSSKSFTIYELPIANAGNNDTICRAQSTTLSGSVSGGIPNYSYSWSTNPSGFTSQQQNPNVSPIVTTTYTLTVSDVNSCKDTSEVILTVNPLKTVTQPSNQVLCNGSLTTQVNFTGTGTYYTWTNNKPSIGLGASGTGDISPFTATNTGNTPVVASIIITPQYTYGGVTCPGTQKTFTITVNPTPSVTQPVNKFVCNGSSTSVSFTGTGNSYIWTNDNTSIGLVASGTGNIAAFTANNTGTSPVVANITVTPRYTNGGVTCLGTPKTFSITVNPIPSIAQPSDQILCNGTSTTLVSFSGTGTSYTWTNSAPSIGLGASGTGDISPFTAINTGSLPVMATITLTPQYTNGGLTCSGTQKTFSITVNPSPTVAQPAYQVVCNGTTTNLVSFSGTGTSYTWTNSATTIGLGASGTGDIPAFTAINAFTLQVVANITVTPQYTNGGVTCQGPPQSFTITVNPTPTVTQPVDQILCNGTSTALVNYTGTGSSYTWTNDTPSIGLSSNGTGNISPFTAINTGTSSVVANITVTPQFTNVGVTCSGTQKTFTITINPTPNVVQPVNQVLCNGISTSLVSLSGTGTSYTWTNNTTSIGLCANGTGDIPSFTAINTGTLPIVGTITVTPQYSNGGITCMGQQKIFTITVNPIPTITQVANQDVCNGASTILVSFSGTGTTYAWTNSSPSIGLNANGTGDISAFTATNTGTVSDIATITVTPQYTNEGVTCSGTLMTFTITVEAPATIQFSSLDQIICSGDTTILVNVSSTTPGAEISWSCTPPAGITGAALSGTTIIPVQTLINSTNLPVTLNYIAVASTTIGLTCVGIQNIYNVTVNHTPSVTQPDSQVVCNGATTSVTFTGTGTSYTWTNNTPSIGLDASGTGDISPFIAINNGDTPVIATITVTPKYTNGGVNSQGLPKIFTITVNHTPTITETSDQILCNGTSSTLISFSGTGTFYTWTNNTTSIGLSESGTDDISPFTTINTGTSPIVATITVTPQYTNEGVTCPGVPNTFTITVNHTPTITQPDNQVVCNGALSTVIYTGTGTSYTWTNNTTSIGLNSSGTGDISPFTAINAGNLPVIATLTATPQFTNGEVTCQGSQKTFTITVNPTPTVTQAANQVVCNGTSTTLVNFTGSGTSYTWTNNTPYVGLNASGTGDISSFTAINTGTSPEVATILVTPQFSNEGVTCQGTAKFFTITVNHTPTVTQPPNQILCNGTSTSLVSFSGTGTSYTWTNDNTSIGLNANNTGDISSFTAVNTGSLPVVATITVTPQFSNEGITCQGLPKTFTITVNPTPTITQVANHDICNGALTTIINFAGTGTSYNWTNDNTSIGLIASGTGDISSFTAMNTGISPVIANISVTPQYTNEGVTCQGSQITFTITVEAPPIVQFSIPNQVICSGNSTTLVNLSSTTAGATTSWNCTPPAGITGTALSGTTGIPVQTLTNSTNLPISIDYTSVATTTIGLICTGIQNTYNVIVNPTPDVTQPSDQVVCNGTSTSVTFIGTGTSYTWTNNTPSIGLGASGTGDISSFAAINTGTSPVIANIAVTPQYTNGGITCQGLPKNFTITVNPPVTMTQAVNQVVCNGAISTLVSFSGTGTSYDWTNNTTSIGLSANGTGDISSFTAINTGTIPIIATITVTPQYTNGGVTCSGTATSFTITVNPTPSITQPDNQVLCNGEPTSVSFTGTGNSYTWSNDNTSIGLNTSGTGNIPSFLAINTGTSTDSSNITATPQYIYGGVTCQGTQKSFTITVNPTPIVTQPANQAVCNGELTSVTFTGTGTSYIWTNNTASIGLGVGGTGNIPSFTATNTGSLPIVSIITVTPQYTNGGINCTGTQETFTITVNPGPSITQPTNQVVCNGELTNITFTGTGTSYSWTNNTTSIGLGASGTGDILSFTAINTGSLPIIATITVTPQYINGGAYCIGTQETFTLTVNPTPTVAQPANQIVCNGESTIVTFTGNSYVWTNNTPSIGLDASGTGNISAFTAINTGSSPVVATVAVTPQYTNGGITCQGTQKFFTITVNPSPTVAGPANQVVCNGALTSIVSFTGTGTSYSWTNNTPSIGLSASGTGDIYPFTATNSGNSLVVASITVTPQYIYGGITCQGAQTTFTITVNPTPSVIQPANQILCNGESTTVTFTGSSYTWTNNNTSIGLGANGTGNISAFTAINAGSSPIIATITVTPQYTNGGITCSGPQKTFTITVNPTPTVVQPINQVICNGSSTTLVNFSGTGTFYTWTNNTTSIGLSANGTGDIPAFTAINTGSIPEVATITITPQYTNGGDTCIGNQKTFTISINPTPTVTAPSNQVVCNGESTTVTFAGTGNSYTWINNNTSIGLGASGTGNISAFSAINTGSIAEVATITVTPQYTNGGVICSGTQEIFTITVNQAPTVSQPTNINLCNGELSNLVSFSGTGTYYTWTNNTPSIGMSTNGTGDISSFTAINTSTVPVYATISVTPQYSNGGVTCQGSEKTFTITVNPSPTVTQPLNIFVCNEALTSVNYTGTGTSYSWTNDNTSIGLGASGTGNISAFAAINTGLSTNESTITVTPQYTNGTATCSGNPETFTITVNPTPTVTQITNQVVCDGSATSLISFSGTGTYYTWSNNTPSIGLDANGTGDIIPFTAINADTLPIIATITVTPQYVNGGMICSGLQMTFTITINQTPVIPHQTAMICNRTAFTVTPENNPPMTIIPSGTTYIWGDPVSNPIGAITGGSAQTIGQLSISQILNNTTYNSATATYTVTPTSGAAGNCIGEPFDVIVTVRPLPDLIYSNDSIACIGTPVLFNNNTTGAQSYLWRFGDGDTSTMTSPAHAYSNQGDFTINFLATSMYGCIDSSLKSIHIIQTPTPDFTVSPNNGCAPLSVLITDMSGTNIDYSWDFGVPPISTESGPFTQIYDQGLYDTTYVIKLVASNMCGSASYTDSVLVYPKPVVNFGMTQNYGCSPVSIGFIDNVAGYSDTIVWDFGDGSPKQTFTSLNNAISHSFSYVGNSDTTYIITLIGINECGYDTMQKTLTIYPNTVNAFFNIDTLSGCAPLSVHLTNYSTGGATYSWNFGDGNLSNLANPSHIFSDQGQYVVMLAVNNGCSRDTTYSDTITVNPTVGANFSFTDNICSGDTVFLLNNTPNIVSCSWNFGDNSPLSTLTNPFHLYNNAGDYQVTLSVTNQLLCSSDITIPVHIKYTPTPLFTASLNSGCSPLSVQFSNITDSISYNTYIWDFNNGVTSVLINPMSQTFVNPGNCADTTFIVSLIANQANCVDTFYTNINVFPKPSSNFITSDSTFCNFGVSENVQFYQEATCANEFQWLVGDSMVSSSLNPSIIFPNSNTYNVSLVVSNHYTCIDTATKIYTVYPEWEDSINIINESGCEPLGVIFQSNYNNLIYHWEFGDNISSYLQNDYHLYNESGFYTVKVHARGISGCVDSLILTNIIDVFPRAIASFTYENAHIPPPNNGTVIFDNKSQNATLFTWDFGDGTMFYGFDTIHRYLHNKDCSVVLIANNHFNCPDTAYSNVNVEFFHGLFIPNAFVPSNSNIKVQNFLPIGIGLETYHIWIYDTWGNLLWESTALDIEGRPSEFWDGRVSGNLLQMDSYVWKATGTFKDGCIWTGMDYGDGVPLNYGTVTIIK